MLTLSSAKVLITGAARGLGREMALAFAGEGAEPILTDIDRQELEQTRGELHGRGARCSSYVMDVTDPGSIARVRDEVHRDRGRLNVLVNNAGIVCGGPFLDTSLEKHVDTVRVNLLGALAVSHAFLPDLIGQTSAHLVNIASASGLVGLPLGSSYASSKWALIGLSESLRLELRLLGHGHVGVTTVCPSYVGTGMFAGAAPPRLTSILDPPDLARKIVRAVKRGEPFVYEPWLVKVTPLIKAVLPTRLTDLLSDLLGATASMSEWKGHGR